MDKETQEINNNIPDKASAEKPENPPLKKIKHSIRHRIGRSLMTTEFRNKDKKFTSEIDQVKDEMHDALDATGFFDSKYVNRLFRLYANKDKDIKIYKAQLRLPKHGIIIPEVPKEETIKMTQYIKALKFIRSGLNPIMHQIRSLAAEAKAYAEKETKKENDQQQESVYETFAVEFEKQVEHGVAKNHLKKLMEEHGYDGDRFSGEKAIMSGYFQQNNYQGLMIFALLGFHYLDRKHEVYDVFTREQLKDLTISLDLPGLRATEIPLGTFLKIIEHLDFKRLFSV